MKKISDPRHLKRREAIKELFSWIFNKETVLGLLAQNTVDHLKLIDSYIKEAAPTWPIEQINRIDLSILRLAVFELLIEKLQPFKVIVDEAVELAKEFGADSSPAFINGVLGKLIQKEGLED